MAKGYEYVERAPTLDEYRALCRAVGWESIINFDAAGPSLDRSLYSVVALHDGAAVGMARLVGDGAMYFYAQDVAVAPEHQGRGVGAALMQKLMDYVGAVAPQQAFVGLFASAGSEPFYERWGFAVHTGLTGMFRVTPL